MNLCYLLLSGLVLSSALAFPVKAQITIDGTTNTQLTPMDNGVRIDEGNRAEGNLFHSFSEFSVPKGSFALFNNANDIVNIFSRVTGGNISDINGLIRANGTANLFLINPAGIIFGENARLDIGGSFLGSTADSIFFSDNVEFLATDADNPPLLTVNMPLGFNLGNNSRDIVNRSIGNNDRGLEVATGESITLVGGNINLEGGKLFAPGGRVEFGGLSVAGEVGINADGSISFPEGVARADVTLTNGAEVNVQGAEGGDISFNAHNIEISGGELGASNLKAGISQKSGSPEAQAGDITLNAEDTITVSQGSRILNRVEESGEGNAGEINLATANLSLREGGRVSATTFGRGNAGAIEINASDTISVAGEDRDGNRSGIVSQVQGEGNAGEINLTTVNLSLREGGRVSATTFSRGNAGAIEINASDTISVAGETQNRAFSSGIFSQTQGEGDSSGIEITTANLSLREGGRVSATTFGRGNAGAIKINASDTISVAGETQNRAFSSGIFSQTQGEGDANNIKINTNNLSLTNDAEISVESLGQGEAGDLFIQANSLALETGASLLGSTSVGTGGNINLQIADHLTLRNNSTISAIALEGADGGNIDINANFVIAFPNQNNDIIARAARGNGGAIDITTRGIFGIEERPFNPFTNDLDASSQFGLDGTIAINELDVDPTKALEELPTDVIDITGLIEQNLCQQAKGSEFIITGKGGIAPAPSEVRDGNVSEVDLVEPVIVSENSEVDDKKDWQNAPNEVKKEIVEAQGWIMNDRGIVELVAYKTDVNTSTAQLNSIKVCP